VKISKLAVETGMWVLYEAKNGKFRFTGPSKLIAEGRLRRKPIKEYIDLQGRFEGMSDKEIAELDQWIELNWAYLKKLIRLFALKDEVLTLYIGKRSLSTYLARCFEIVDSSESDKVQIWIEGMGRNIVKVVDLVNFLKRFMTKKNVRVLDFQIDLVPKKEVHGLPKHVSRLKILVEISEAEHG